MPRTLPQNNYWKPSNDRCQQNEPKITRKRSHLDMVSAQFLARSIDINHVCHGLLQKPTPPCNMKLSTHMNHKTVTAAITSTANPNYGKTFGNSSHPPSWEGNHHQISIRKKKSDLPRNVRCTLSKLCSPMTSIISFHAQPTAQSWLQLIYGVSLGK